MPWTPTPLNRRRLLQYGTLAVGAGLLSACSGRNDDPSANQTPEGRDRVTLGTDWFAQAEHGGFYQAQALNIYRDYGLEVTIRMGGPQAATGTQLLLGGAVDFAMSNGTIAINAVTQGAPKVTVAGFFQKDPRCLIAHPEPKVEQLEGLNDRPIFIIQQAVVDFWGLLVKRYGFKDSNRRVYNFNVGPFLADPTSVQQGFITSEPYTIETEGGFKPQVFLLADYGYTPYATTIDTTRATIEQRPDVVKRFVQASAKGWYSYLDDPTAGNALIQKDYPEMSSDRLAYGLKTMQEYGIVLSGDAIAKGIGHMSDQRWQDFFDSMVEAGVFESSVDYRAAYTLDFVQELPTSA